MPGSYTPPPVAGGGGGVSGTLTQFTLSDVMTFGARFREMTEDDWGGPVLPRSYLFGPVLFLEGYVVNLDAVTIQTRIGTIKADYLPAIEETRVYDGQGRFDVEGDGGVYLTPLATIGAEDWFYFHAFYPLSSGIAA